MDKNTEQNLLDIVRRNYQEIVTDFDTTRKKQLWPEIFRLAEQVKDGGRVLDVGSGNGRLLQAFGKKKINYIGVDSSEELIEKAKDNFQDRGSLMDTKFEVRDILELDKLPERDFDYVFCIAVLHHLPGRDLRIKALKELSGKISANGKIIITVWNLWPQQKFRNLIIKAFWQKITGQSKLDFGDILFDWKNNQGEKVSRRYYHAFTKRGLKKLFKQAGLKIEKLYSDGYNYYAVLGK